MLSKVLIIGPWNYPFMLAFMPLCAAIAAGNCAVIKPSELSPHSAALIADLVPKYLDNSCFKVITGEIYVGSIVGLFVFLFESHLHVSK